MTLEHLGDLGVVRGEQDDPAPAGDVLQQHDDPLAGVVVELRGGFVGEQQLGAAGERDGDHGALALAACYPFMKRYTFYPQVVLGAAFSWGMPMAFTAETGSLPPEAWLLFIANLLWTVAYDTYYAMADREDDLKIGVKSTAILFGDADRLIIASLQGLALLAIPHAGSAVVFYVLCAIVYTCYGGGFGTMPATAGDYFGVKYAGAIYGLMLVGWSLGVTSHGQMLTQDLTSTRYPGEAAHLRRLEAL